MGVRGSNPKGLVFLILCATVLNRTLQYYYIINSPGTCNYACTPLHVRGMPLPFFYFTCYFFYHLIQCLNGSWKLTSRRCLRAYTKHPSLRLKPSSTRLSARNVIYSLFFARYTYFISRIIITIESSAQLKSKLHDEHHVDSCILEI